MSMHDTAMSLTSKRRCLYSALDDKGGVARNAQKQQQRMMTTRQMRAQDKGIYPAGRADMPKLRCNGRCRRCLPRRVVFGYFSRRRCRYRPTRSSMAARYFTADNASPQASRSVAAASRRT